MHQTNYLVREPLLDPKQRVVGYELTWQGGAGQVALPTQAALEDLVAFVASEVYSEQDGWLLRDKTLFLEAVPGMVLGYLATHGMRALRV